MAESGSAQIIAQLHGFVAEFEQRLATASTEHEIRQAKAAFLGKQGALAAVLKQLGSLSAAERPLIGQAANQVKQQIESRFTEALQSFQQKKQSQRLAADTVDPTLPGLTIMPGSLHPISLVMEEITDLFRKLGFAVHEGPQVEQDYYNFEALNIAEDHPARDMQDTFYLEDMPAHVLRTHTSPVQIHTMERQAPPIQMIAPGPVYRKDSDVTHTPLFHQVEGLFVDQAVTFAELKGILEIFLQEFFGPDTKVRFRPSYFPFTEPSAEVDIYFDMFGKSGWMEVMGCGMVHPAVFKSVGYNPDEVQGFAFGMGVERLAMLKYQINDIRLFYENDMRFLEQFS